VAGHVDDALAGQSASSLTLRMARFI